MIHQPASQRSHYWHGDSILLTLETYACKSSEPTLITATLNNLAALVKTRPPLAQKVIGAVLGFNPFSKMPRTITVHDRLMAISMEKTVRIMLLNVVRYVKSLPSCIICGGLSANIRAEATHKRLLREESHSTSQG